jgi:hypothetical protein
MKKLYLSTLLLLASPASPSACNTEQATETNVMPAPCSRDEDCPRGVACNFFDMSADGGYRGVCDVL